MKIFKIQALYGAGTFVIIKGRIEQNRWGKGLEFTVHAMELQGLRK